MCDYLTWIAQTLTSRSPGEGSKGRYRLENAGPFLPPKRGGRHTRTRQETIASALLALWTSKTNRTNADLFDRKKLAQRLSTDQQPLDAQTLRNDERALLKACAVAERNTLDPATNADPRGWPYGSTLGKRRRALTEALKGIDALRRSKRR